MVLDGTIENLFTILFSNKLKEIKKMSAFILSNLSSGKLIHKEKFVENSESMKKLMEIINYEDEEVVEECILILTNLTYKV